MSASLRTITGWEPRKHSDEYSDPLAYGKFAVFALVVSLLVPDAARQFRRVFQTERNEIANEHRCLRMLRKTKRGKEESRRLEQRVDKLHVALFDSCYSADATAKNITETKTPFPPPHWKGEPRPYGSRNVRLHSQFPSVGYLTRLVSQFGYEGSAAVAALSRAHEPWSRPQTDRRKANPWNADEQSEGQNQESSLSAPMNPYYPASPSRRTKVGGEPEKEKVVRALEQRGWDANTQAAIFEVVYFKQSAKRVAAKRGLKIATVYQYASRLRGDLKAA